MKRIVKQMRRQLRRAVERSGYDVSLKPSALMQKDVEFSPSIELLAPYVSQFVPQVTFVQVGAYDGQSNDPLLSAALKHHWRGVLVEPQNQAFAKLQLLHCDRPEFILKRVAIGPVNEQRPLYKIKEQPGLPDWAYQNASFDRMHMQKVQNSLRKKGIEGCVEEEMVQCVTFEQLLLDVGIERVDVLQVDAEGYDFEILKLFDVKERLPMLINYEHAHLSKKDRNAAVELLIEAGYRISMTNADTLALRTPQT